MCDSNIEALQNKALKIRQTITEMNFVTRAGHLSSSLSCIEILVALYYGKILCITPSNVRDIKRNRLVLDKGHCCMAQYAILADLDIIPEEWIWNFCKKDAILGGHPNYLLNIPGIESSSGSLGHGLAYAEGVALGIKYRGYDARVYVIVGDGELQEGSIWEAALSIAHHKLDNVIIIIDDNKIQGTDFTQNIISLGSLSEKWMSFGYNVQEIDGHDMHEVMAALENVSSDKPNVIVASTIKGKGLSFIENNKDWHARKINGEEWEIARKELKIEESRYDKCML